MSSRDTVFASIRRSLGVTGEERPRRDAVAERMARHPKGLLPKRGQVEGAERLALFAAMVEASGASFARLERADDIPGAVAAYLRDRNLPSRLRRGDDARLASLPWATTSLEMSVGRSNGDDLSAISHAFGAVAESGTLALVSGQANPTTLNFLPDHHIVVVDARDVSGDYEALWERLRDKYGHGLMPRTVNWVTGPSRSADIEQKLLFGAHGPRSLHVVMVG